MAKIALVLLAAAAFAAALVLVLARRPAPGSSTSRFGMLVAFFVAALTGAPRSASAGPPDRAAAEKAQTELAGKLRQRSEWSQLKKAWLEVLKLAGDYDAIAKTVAAKKAAAGKLLAPLVKARLISQQGSTAFAGVYADRVYHQLRAHSNATCYDPTQLGWKLQLTREDLERRLVLLEGIKARGTLKPETLEKLERTIKKQMEIVLRVAAAWDKQPKDPKGDWSAYRKEEQAVLALLGNYDSKTKTMDIKDSVSLRPGLEEAMRLIRLVYVD